MTAKDFLDRLEKGQIQTQATVVGLSGELGAGKTTFTQAVAKALGITDTVTSPTFVIEKIYEIPARSRFKRFIHIDAYRLESPDELVKLGFAEIIADPGNLIFIEWPERLAGLIPRSAFRLKFAHVDENTRTIAEE